jgi:transcriptional regulator with XRE-family HTH domain
MERKPTYIRAWRKAGGADRKPGGYTLEEMVGRLEELGVRTTAATLSRVETGKVPYSQDIIEAIAEALGVTVAHLVEDNPDIPSTPVADFVRRLNEKEAAQAEAVLRAMFEKQA